MSDVVALLMSYGANRAGKLPPTPEHTFAFRRVEIVVAFFNSAALIAVAAWVAYEGVLRLLHPVEVGGATVMLVAGIRNGGQHCSRMAAQRRGRYSTPEARSCISPLTRSRRLEW